MAIAPPPAASRWSRPSTWLIGAGVGVVAIVAFLVTQLLSSTASAETADLSHQGGEGVWAADGATLTRTADTLGMELNVPRPMPGEYEYPPAQQPNGDYHPPVSRGEEEVFTLWMFVFNHPELCRDPHVCRLVDVFGDETTPEPPARGGIFQVDGVIATGNILEMSGVVTLESPAVQGVPLTNPLCSQVHIGMAPHGKALESDELEFQLSNTIGGPEWFWAAEFTVLDPENGC